MVFVGRLAYSESEPHMNEEQLEITRLSHKVVTIQAGVLAFVGAILGGVGLFVMTAWLLIKGGHNIGSHLRLLGHYLIGYSVTWKGSFVGLLYGAVIGGLIGWCIAKIYNWIVQFRLRTGKDSSLP